MSVVENKLSFNCIMELLEEWEENDANFNCIKERSKGDRFSSPQFEGYKPIVFKIFLF
jgi:hypothetical protein